MSSEPSGASSHSPAGSTYVRPKKQNTAPTLYIVGGVVVLFAVIVIALFATGALQHTSGTTLGAKVFQMTRNGNSDDRESLQGVWNVQSIEKGVWDDGKPTPPEVVKRLRFTFKGDKLVLKGGFADDEEVSYNYKIDATKSPKHLDMYPIYVQRGTMAPLYLQSGQMASLFGIYEINGDELKFCWTGRTHYRPTEFSSKGEGESGGILIVLKREKP
jgi:uncharacterized protein (TIGR03067 family)